MLCLGSYGNPSLVYVVNCSIGLVMSDSVCDVKTAEADGFAVPAILLESQRPIISGRINPGSALPGTLPSKRHEAHLLEDNSLSAESTPHACGEATALLGMLSPGTERPKSGLTKTKRNLKKQLHRKMAALDDGRQTPNLPSPNPYPEDASRASVASVVVATASAKDAGSVEQRVNHEEKQHEPSSTTECQNVTIKVELPDDDYPSSAQPGISNTKHFDSSFPSKKVCKHLRVVLFANLLESDVYPSNGGILLVHLKFSSYHSSAFSHPLGWTRGTFCMTCSRQ